MGFLLARDPYGRRLAASFTCLYILPLADSFLISLKLNLDGAIPPLPNHYVGMCSY